jgi:predicted enzyme related to lactoylglutathione lyase
MSVNTVLAGMAVADFEAAVSWYERLVGRPADQRPMGGLAEWHFPGTGVIQVIQDPERAGKSLLTLMVDDLAADLAAVAERGVDTGPLDDTTSDKVLVAPVTDPAGNAITLVEPRT